MSLLFSLLLQAVQATPPERIDLMTKQACEGRREAPDEIVVCGRNSKAQQYRHNEPLAEREADIPQAEVQLVEGVTLTVESEGGDAGGRQSNRAMVRLKIKF